MNLADREYAIGRGIASIRGKSVAENRFLKSCIEFGLPELLQKATGSTFPNLSKRDLAEIPIRNDLDHTKIGLLSLSFDDLIENNARRIEILEEMAQAIYREWFVEFRYPGHKGVPLVHSELGPIPEGWAARSLQDVIELAYGKALKSGDRRGGPVPVFGSGGVVGSHDVPLVNGPGIVVGRKGNVGSVHWSDDSFFPIDTTFYVKTDLPMAYAYYMLCDAEFIDSHAAVPGLSREQAYGLNCLVPDRQVVEKFGVVVGQIFALRKVLEESNRNLLETRDLLLPRLVSGEIDVSELDIPDEQDSPA
jgi:type I restriction enzyme S subunit